MIAALRLLTRQAVLGSGFSHLGISRSSSGTRAPRRPVPRRVPGWTHPGAGVGQRREQNSGACLRDGAQARDLGMRTERRQLRKAGAPLAGSPGPLMRGGWMNISFEHVRAEVMELWSGEPIADPELVQSVVESLTSLSFRYSSVRSIDPAQGLWDIHPPGTSLLVCNSSALTSSRSVSARAPDRLIPGPCGAGLGGRGGSCIRGGRGEVPELAQPRPQGLGSRLLLGQLRTSGTRQGDVRPRRLLPLPGVNPEPRIGKWCTGDVKAYSSL
jgi:hypothetical protein